MPKTVDHEGRRKYIADALLTIAAERGIESVTVRQVAAAAGVSTGMVQHYFKTKDAMMTFAIEVVQERVRARLEASVANGDGGLAPTTFVRSLLHELLPRDRHTRNEARVTLAFLAYAAVHPGAGRLLRSDFAELLRVLTETITQAQASSEIRAELDAAVVSRTLLALMEGLGLHVLSGYYTADEAMAAFDTYAELLLR